MVVLMPQHRCHNLSSSSWGGCPSAVWLLLLLFRGWETHFISSSVYGIIALDCSFVLHYFIMRQIKNRVLYGHRCYAAWRWVTSTLAFNHPQLPCIRYTAIITCPDRVCYLLFFLCVNFCNCRYRSRWGLWPAL